MEKNCFSMGHVFMGIYYNGGLLRIKSISCGLSKNILQSEQEKTGSMPPPIDSLPSSNRQHIEMP